MSFKKTSIRLGAVGTLVTAALLGQEQPGGQQNSTDVSQLKEALTAQQEQLQQQQQEIQDLKSLLQKQAADQTSRTGPPPNTKIAGVPGRNATASQPAASNRASGAGLTEPVLTTPEPTKVPDFEPDQEYEKAKPEEAGIETGPAQFRPRGYLAQTSRPGPPPNTKIGGAPGPRATASQPAASNPASGAGPTEPVMTTPEPTKVPDFEPDQEYEKAKPQEAGIEIGPAQFRPGGYLALTGLWRSATSSGGTGTPFARVPFPNTVLGQDAETRLSAQSTRLSLRVDVPFPEGHFRKVSGYIETDFNGTTPGSVALTSTSVGFRLRHAFVEAQYGDHWFFVIGQAFSLMTPPKDQLSIWPADYEMTQAVDTNYVAGLTFGRIPQGRITWRPKKSFNWAFSVENPEQQVLSGGVIIFPTCCASDLAAQYNEGSDEFKTPNLAPDFHTRIAFNTEKIFHIDIGGVLRTIHHTINPFTSPFTFSQTAGGGSVNTSVRVTKNTKLIAQGTYGVGIGRYIGALFPDVVVRPNLTINPLPTASWVSGLEQNVNKNLSIGAYYSGGWVKRSYYLQPDGTFIGYGFPGSPDLDNRQLEEATLVATWRIYKTEKRGSVQWGTQFSWFSRTPYASVPRLVGTGQYYSAQPFMMYTMLRYNLP